MNTKSASLVKYKWNLACIMVMLLITLFSCNSSFTPVLNSAQGVQFKVSPLSGALAIAKSQNKPLFVFLHATWCPTCKQMENEVLNKKELGDKFNQSFVNVAIDYDSAEGKNLDKLYKIHATPTLLFFDAKGNIIKRIDGGVSGADLLGVAGAL